MFISEERIRDRINDFKASEKYLLEDLEAYAIQKSSQQMQVKEKNTELLEDIILVDADLISVVFDAKLKSEQIADTVKKFRDVWIKINGFSKEEENEIIKKSKNKIYDKIREKFCSEKEEI